LHFALLIRRSRQRERLIAMGISVFVCLLVCRQNAKTRFSQKLSNLELWSLWLENIMIFSKISKYRKYQKYDIFNIFYFRAICRFISEMMQHTAIVTMEGE